MKYKVGDEVILRDDLKESNNLEDHYTNDMEHLKNRAHTIEEVTALDNYVIDGWFVTHDMIDHEKTDELKLSEYEKYITEKINDPAHQELLKELSEPIIDAVNHPSHYNQGEIETIDIIKELTRGYTGFEAYLVGSVIKYIARANFKGNKQEDLEKAEFYYNRLLKEGESSL